MTWPAALAMAVVAAVPILLAAQGQPAPHIVKITGDQHKLLLRSDGTVAGWGQYLMGQLGPLADITSSNRLVTNALVPIALPAKVVDIAAGNRASYVLLDDGSVMAWGAADAGQLGNGQVEAPLLASSTQSMQYRGIETPTRIAGLTDVASIVASDRSSFAVLRDGTVRAWGGGTFRPVTVPGLVDVVAVSAASGAALALTKDGRVFSWGSNFYGALGRPPRTEKPLDTPGEIPGLRDVAQAITGLGVSTALKKDGTVWVWGSNWQQQFGFPAPTNQPNLTDGWVLEPQQVPGVVNVTAIAMGGRHTIALLKDGTLRAWGNSDWGQTGTGGGAGFQPRPTAPKIAGVVTVFAAGGNSFAIRNDGTLWAWGAGGTGEFPLTSNVRVPAPAPAGLR